MKYLKMASIICSVLSLYSYSMDEQKHNTSKSETTKDMKVALLNKKHTDRYTEITILEQQYDPRQERHQVGVRKLGCLEYLLCLLRGR